MLESLRRAVRRVDGWVNMMTGVGAGRGRGAFDFALRGRVPDAVLEDLFHEDPIVYRMCAAPPEEALRRGFELKLHDVELEQRLSARLRELGVAERLKEAWTWSRLFGGCLLVLGIDDGRPMDEPLDECAIRSVEWLAVVEKRWAFPEVTGSLAGLYGHPEVYRIQKPSGQPRYVHHTRTLRFDGTLTTMLRRARNYGWSDSVVTRAYDSIQKFSGSFEGAVQLIQDASQGVFKFQNLYGVMAADKDDTFKRRMELMDMSRSVARAILIDKDREDYTRVETTLTGLPDTLDKMMLLVAQAVEMPVTVLFGQSPAGLNATGDSDIRWWYDRVASAQKTVLGPRLERLVRLLAREQGAELPALEVKWLPLWEPSAKEDAERRGLIATADTAYVQAGVLTPEEVASSRFRADGFSAETVLDTEARRVAHPGGAEADDDEDEGKGT